jgi:hypothetical protein
MSTGCEVLVRLTQGKVKPALLDSSYSLIRMESCGIFLRDQKGMRLVVLGVCATFRETGQLAK